MSWLTEYLDYCDLQESPDAFHMWAGLTGVASVLNRNVWLPRVSADGVERFKNYPGQLMTVLVAGPGLTRKSTAISIIQGLLKDAAASRLYVGKITPEQLLHKLGSFPDNRAVLTLIADELSVFLSKQQYAEPMVNILTKLANALDDDEYETRAVKMRLLSACVTMLAATTPSSLGLSIPPEAHQHGFQSRLTYVYADKSDKIEPLTTDPATVDPQLIRKAMRQREYLIQGLRDMSRLRGPFSTEPDAKRWFDKWYRQYRDSPASFGEGWPSRRAEHLLRTAMLMQISGDLTLRVTVASLVASDALLARDVESNFQRSFAYIGRHANNEQLRKIVSLFDRQGSIVSAEDIYLKTMRYFSDIKALQMGLESLRVAGVLTSHTGPNGESWELLKEYVY